MQGGETHRSQRCQACQASSQKVGPGTGGVTGVAQQSLQPAPSSLWRGCLCAKHTGCIGAGAATDSADVRLLAR